MAPLKVTPKEIDPSKQLENTHSYVKTSSSPDIIMIEMS